MPFYSVIGLNSTRICQNIFFGFRKSSFMYEIRHRRECRWPITRVLKGVQNCLPVVSVSASIRLSFNATFLPPPKAKRMHKLGQWAPVNNKTKICEGGRRNFTSRLQKSSFMSFVTSLSALVMALYV